MAEVSSHWQNGPLQVVRNGAGVFSIWPAERALPAGWTAAGFSGPRADCLAFIAREWTSLAPADLREHGSVPEYSVPADERPLVDRLVHEPHTVRASGVAGCVHITLAHLPGAPEIGLLVQPGSTATEKAAVLEGTCVLDGTPLTAVVTLDSGSLSGTAIFSQLPDVRA